MRNFVASMAAALLIIVGAGLGSAAENQAPPNRHPPPEVGVGVDRLFPVYGDYVTDNVDEPIAHVRVTLPFMPRFAFEGIGTIGRRGNEYWQRTEGLFFLQIRQRLRRDQHHPFQPFITYGAVGYYSHLTQRDYQVPQPGGGEKTYSGFSYTETEPPLATAFGAGFQQQLGSHVALRADAQLVTFVYLPLGFRLSGGVSIPIRRYSRN
jgi:hypothetical protein